MLNTKQKSIQQNIVQSFLYLFLVVFWLSSCGGSGGGTKPPEIPKGTAAGNAVDALIIDGTITAYSWAKGEQGEKLGQTVTDDNGGYSLELQTEDTPLLLVLEGGWYTEESSGERVSLLDGQRLYAVTYYEKGDTVSIMLTPMTTLAYGLTQHYITEDGENVQNAITKANSGISALFNFDILTVCPANITDGANSSPVLSDELMAGFYCAAFSSWSEQLSLDNNLDAHSYYNSIYLSQIMYSDIVYDGQLDGVGWSSSGMTVVPLHIGTTSIDSQVYRKMIGWHIIQAVNSEYNKSALDIEDLIGTADQFSQQINSFFANELPLPLDVDGPEIERLSSSGTIFAKHINFQFTITDECGVKHVSVDWKGETSTVIAGEDGVYSFGINTEYYDDGEHTLTITAIDNLDNATTEDHTIIINNAGVGIGVTSNNRTNEHEFLLSGYYVNSGTSVESITVRDNYGIVMADLDEDTSTWSADVTLDSGLNSLLIESTDNVGTKTSLGFDIGLDQNAPMIYTGPHSEALFKTDTGTFTTQLDNNNEEYPIYIDLKKASLNGTSPTDTLALDDAGIPYFIFSVEDPNDDDGISTPDNELTVTMDFTLGSTELVTDRSLTPILNTSDFVIPLTVETLHEDWDNTNDGKGNILTVKCIDNAGNLTTTEFKFTVYFQTPVITVRSLNYSSDVILYAYETGALGGIIQTAKTDSDGKADVNIISSPRPIMARITGGNYYEMGTGNHVSMAANQQLDCVFMYDGNDMDITISPLTHIASALAMKKIADGDDVETAIIEANSAISYIYGVDIIGAYPLDINDVSNATTEVTDNYEYGFLLAGMSKWTDDAAQINGASNQSVYNSLLLADRMGDDINLDGMLDGDYAFGAVILGPSVYRNGIAYGILDVVQSDENETSLDEDDMLNFMIDVAENSDPIYGSEPVMPFDTDGPLVVATGFSSGDYFADDADLNFAVTDMTGVDSVRLFIGGELATIAINPDNPNFIIDTTKYPEGAFTFEIQATDIQGNTSSTAFTITIDNVDPVLTITSDSVTNDTSFTVTGSVTDDGSGVASLTIDNQSVTIQSGGLFSEGVSLSVDTGHNVIPYTIIDNKGKQFTGSFNIDVDTQPAMIEASPDYNSSGRFYSAPHVAYTADISQNNATPFYVEYWKTSLNGTPIDVNDLTGAGYMYFFVRFWDVDGGNGITTPANDLILEQQYLQGETIVDDWHEIPDQVWSYSVLGNVIVPITDEIIDPSWKTVGANVKQTIKLRATDRAGNQAVKTFTFYALVEPFEITTQSLPDNIRGQAYSQTLTAVAGVAPYTWVIQAGTPPCDLSLSSAGVLSGSGTTTWCSPGAYQFTVRVTDSLGAYIDKQYTINLIAPLNITNGSSISLKNNSNTSISITATGGYGSGHYAFTMPSGSLPNGLTFASVNNQYATITGAPALGWYGVATYNYTFTIKVRDLVSGLEEQKTFNLAVSPDIKYSFILWSTTGQPSDETVIRYYVQGSAVSEGFCFWNGMAIPAANITNQTPYNGWLYRMYEKKDSYSMSGYYGTETYELYSVERIKG